MPRIQANRDSVDDRFSVLGFTVRTESPLFEVGVATDPTLFRADKRSERNHRNFYSSRNGGAIRARRGEAVYLVPPEVLANFVGQPKMYFGLATYRDNSRGRPDYVQSPSDGHMYVNLSGLTERGLRRLSPPARNGGRYGAAAGSHDASLEWGGDALQPEAQDTANGNGIAATGAGSGGAAPDANRQAAAAAPYDDGFGEFPDRPAAPAAGPGQAHGNGAGNTHLTLRGGSQAPQASARDGAATIPQPDVAPSTAQARAQALGRRTWPLDVNAYTAAKGGSDAALEADDGAHGIDGPIPDEQVAIEALEAPAAHSPQPEYPGASRFAAAHWSNFRAVHTPRDIQQIVIHITDGGARIDGTIGWFQNPNQRNAKNQPIHVSAHYVVGRDGEVVQMLLNNDVGWHANRANAHSIGIEHNANTRGLMPTEEQYRGSAALVAWLCAQFSLPIDRMHVLGHAEADTATTHTACPNAIWDWEHYIACVHEAAAAASHGGAAVAQSLGASRGGARRLVARAQEIITPFYDPADPASALTCQADAFSQAREEWFAGVPNTTLFPHSAICQLLMTAPDGSGYIGTGFYIGANRILTCAHNLQGMSNVTIVPGKNGTDKPFGESTVAASSWRLPSAYTGDGNWDNDLAVIDNVPLAAPGGRWFGFLNATPSDQMPIVVCGYAKRSVTVPGLTQAIDGDKQHLHGGYATGQSGSDVIEYPILTLKGNSGSPVYHLDTGSGQLQALICAVHVSGEPAASGLNRGCFITPRKIDWIEGRTAAFATAQSFRRGPPVPLRRQPAQARSLQRPHGRSQLQVSPRSHAQGMFDLLPVDLKLRVFIPSPVIYTSRPLVSDVVAGGDARGFSVDGGSSRCEINAKFHFGGDGTSPALSDVSRSFGESTNYSLEDTVAVAGKPEWWRDLRAGAQPTERGRQSVTDQRLSVALGGSSHAGVVSMAEGAVVVTLQVHASDPIISLAADIDATLELLLKVDGDRVKVRVIGGHDEFPAYELYANGTLIYAYDPVAQGGTPIGLLGDGNWDVNPDTSYVDVGPASEYRVIGPVRIDGAQAQALAAHPRARPLSAQSIAVHWDTAPYYPQSSDRSCWAASAAMVVGWRDARTVHDTEIADKVPVFDAYKTGLFPTDRRALADAWNLVPEPPASYTVDSWVDLLQTCGPVYVDMTWDASGGGHARVLVGIETDGAPDGSNTRMFMHDPWPETPGKISLSFADFIALYEGRTDTSGEELQYQILHSGSVPAGRQPVTAAPFALTLAEDAEPQVQAGDGLQPGGTQEQAGGQPPRFSLAPAPAPVALAHNARSDAMVGPGGQLIAGAVVERIAGNGGDISWTLDQLHGYKHPNDIAPNPMPAAQNGPVVRLEDWPKVSDSYIDDIYAGFEINWQYNGKSIGNVTITNISTNDAVGWGLIVTATVMDDNRVLPPENPTYAVLPIRFHYRFTHVAAQDQIAVVDVRLFGHGRYTLDYRWEQTGIS